MMRVVSVFAIACVCLAAAQSEDNNTATNDYPPPQYPMPQGGDVMGVMGMVQMQEQIMSKYASVFLEFQNANAWAHAIGVKAFIAHKTAADARRDGDLEEDNSEDEDNSRDLEFVGTGGMGGMGMGGMGGYGSNMFAGGMGMIQAGDGDDEAKNLELTGETTVMYCLKIMWLTSAKRLEAAHKTHYQNKLTMVFLQASGAGQHPALTQLLYLMYYKDILNTMGSQVSILRQDSWTQWMTTEILETEQFEKDDLPESLEAMMVTNHYNAMSTWFSETAITLQNMMLDYYMNMIVTQLGGGFAANANAASASFLEEGVEETPSGANPSFGPMNMGGAYQFQYWVHLLRVYSAMSEFLSAQASYTTAQLKVMQLHADNGDIDDDKLPNMSDEQLKMLDMTALSHVVQWASTKQMLAFYDVMALWYAPQMAASHNAAAGAAVNNFVQADAQTAPVMENENVDPVAPAQQSVVG